MGSSTLCIPLSIVQIRSESRKKYTRMSEAKMRGMLAVTGNKLVKISKNGFYKNCTLDRYFCRWYFTNKTTHQNMLAGIKALETQGRSFNEIIDVLRPTTVPEGYTPYWWREGI